MAHARLSPSKAKMWMACPGSIRMSEGMIDSSSVYADEGTAAHHLASECLHQGLAPLSFLGDAISVVNGAAIWGRVAEADTGAQIRSFPVDEEMVENVELYVAAVRERAMGRELFVEQRVSMVDLIGDPDAGGTADALLVDIENGHFEVHDLKYGRGEPVYAKDNPQLYLYALGAFEQMVGLIMPEPKTVTVAIHQPRKGSYDEHTLPFSELVAFAAQVSAAAQATRRPDASLVPGPAQCRWCLVKAHCPALAQEVLTTVSAAPVEEFADLTAPSAPETLDDGTVAAALSKVGMIEDWCTAIRARAVRVLEEGRQLPGYKLVAGKKGPRQWLPDSQGFVEDYLSNTVRLSQDEIFSRKLISPTKIEKLIGPVQYKRLAEFIVQSAGSPAIVPESDGRPAIKPAVAAPDEFEPIKE